MSAGGGFVSRIPSTFSEKRTLRRQERAEVNTIHINTAISACRREKKLGSAFDLFASDTWISGSETVALDLGVFVGFCFTHPN